MAPAGDDVYVSDSEAAGLVDDIYESDPLLNQDFDFGEVNTRKVKRQKQIMVTASILFLWIGVVFSGAVFVFYNDPTLKQLFRPGATFGLVPCNHSLECNNGYCVANQCTPCSMILEIDCGLEHSASAKWCSWDLTTATCGVSRRHALASAAHRAFAPNTSIPRISMAAGNTPAKDAVSSTLPLAPTPAPPPSKPAKPDTHSNNRSPTKHKKRRAPLPSSPNAASQSIPSVSKEKQSVPSASELKESSALGGHGSQFRMNATRGIAAVSAAASKLRVDSNRVRLARETGASVPCADDPFFQDEFYAARCSFFGKAADTAGCFDLTYWGSQFRYTDTQLDALRHSCPVTCDLCPQILKSNTNAVPDDEVAGTSTVAVPKSVPQLVHKPGPGLRCRFTPLNGTQLTPCTADSCSGIDWVGFTNLDVMSAVCYHFVKDYCQANLFDFVGCTPQLFTALRGYGDKLSAASLAASFADIDNPSAAAATVALAPQQLTAKTTAPAPASQSTPPQAAAAAVAKSMNAAGAAGVGAGLRTITTQCADIETPNDFSYHWVHALTLGPSRAVVVSVRAAGDARVGLFVKRPGPVTPSQNVPPRTYEFVLGAQSNTQTEIRRHDVKGSRVTATTKSGVLSVRSTRSFWLTAKGGLLRCGFGGHVGANITAAWKDQIPLDVQYVGVETIGGTGAWTVCSVEVQTGAGAAPVDVTTLPALRSPGPHSNVT